MQSAAIFQAAMAILQPKIQEQGGTIKKKGTVVIEQEGCEKEWLKTEKRDVLIVKN